MYSKTSFLVFVIFIISTTAFSQQAGFLDESFGDNGTVTTNLYDNFNEGNALAVHADGRIVMAGYVWNDDDDRDFIFAQYLEDGSLDNGFSEDGMLRLNYPGSKDLIYDVLVQPDEKIVAVGTTGNDASTDFAIVRLNDDGTLDNTFSSDGLLTVDFDVWDEGRAVALQEDGKIIVAGFTDVSDYSQTDLVMCRLNENGTLDNSFGNGGKVIYDVNWESLDKMNDVVVYNGNIFVSGYLYGLDESQGVAVVKFDENGNVVQSFGDNGVAYYDLNVNDMILWAGSKLSVNQAGIYVAANDTWGFDSDMAIVNFLHNGFPNEDFGDHGLVVVEMVVNSDARCIALQNDGKILVGGALNDDDSGIHNAFVARFLPDGTMDAGFGENFGVEIVDIGEGNHEIFRSICLDYDSRIIAAGSVVVDNSDFFMARLYSGLEVGIAEPKDPVIENLKIVNPVSDHQLELKFELPASTEMMIHLYTVEGRKLGNICHRKFTQGSHNEYFQLPPEIVPGIYILQIQTGEYRKSFKLLIN